MKILLIFGESSGGNEKLIDSINDFDDFDKTKDLLV